MSPDTSPDRSSIPTLTISSESSGDSAPPNAEGPAAAPEGPHDALKHLTSALARRLAPLTDTISSEADRLVDAPSPRRRRESAMDVLEASAHIDDLLAALRHYSHPEEPCTHRVHVSDVVEDTVAMVADSNQTRIRTKVEPEAAHAIEADPTLLRQALLNLLQNALEATAAPETVLLRAACADPASDADAQIDFEVWNDGEIELDDPSAVFQPFYSAHPQRLGLGLPIASRIAEQHDGTLRLSTNSAAEGGTCFTLQV